MRLPAKSVLTLSHGLGGSVTVVEQLKGEAPAAVFATAFALFVAWTAGSVTVGQTAWVLRHRHTAADFIVLAILAAAVLAEGLLAALIIRNTWRRAAVRADAGGLTAGGLRHRHTAADFIVLAILAAAVLAEVLLAALIIRNTWRRTTLRADAEGLTLEFAAPFMRRWRRQWPSDDVQEIALSVTQLHAHAEGLAELQIRATGTIVHLFTDHRVTELEHIERELDRVLARLPPPYVRVAGGGPHAVNTD